MADDDALSLPDILQERRHLMDVAFRMLGTTADAEDVVQETYIRWYRLDDAERTAIRNAQAWLTRVAARICLDQLGSARVRRERYVGQWLPEPVPGSAGADDPADRITVDESVRMALLVALDALTPAQRVAFVLHDVFAVPFEEVAEIVGRTPEACRKLASTARRDIADRRRREGSHDDRAAVVRAFHRACAAGDVAGLAAVLDPGVTVRSDGGGGIRAAINPIVGADRVSRFLLGSLARWPHVDVEEALVGGDPVLVLCEDEVVRCVVGVDVVGGAVRDVWIVLDPDKLRSWRRG